jgi:hypothetical protein
MLNPKNKNEMKKFLVIVFVVLNLQAFGQEKVILEKPVVDKRVELLSIVFRLAEKPEYSSTAFKLYTDKIEHYFGKHKNHELIRFTQSIINEREIGYDAPMTMAVHLDNELNLLTDVKSITDEDSRWTKNNAKKFVTLLQQFVKDTEFELFFKENADLYAETAKRFAPVYEQMDLNWYRTFYGKEPTETFKIIIGLSNGDSNYGPSLDYISGERTVYAIMGVDEVDRDGIPVFGMNNFPILIHEFNHSFANDLIDNNIEEFRESGEKLYSVSKDLLSKQSYGKWETMMREALVRASVIKYMEDHNYDQQIIKSLTNWEKKECGFFWMEELVAELQSYDNQRKKYPTLEMYIPKLIEAYKIWAEKMPNV